MSAQPAIGGKICAVCGKDVSASPRVKDSQDRYVCQGACEQAAKARAAQPSVPRMPDAGGMGMMSQLLDQSPMTGAAPCGNCGNPMPRGTVLCTRCGFDARTGRTARTRVIVEKAPKAPGAIKMPRRRGEFGPSFGVLFLLCFGLIGGLAALGAATPMFLAVALLLAIGAQVVGMIWGIYSAFVSGESMWGIIGVISFILPGPGLAFAYYLLLPNEDKWSKSLYASGLVGLLTCLAVAFGVHGGPDALTGTLGP